MVNEGEMIKLSRGVWRGPPEGRRPLGKPRIRLDSQVLDDVKKLSGDVEMARNKRIWKQLIVEGKNLLEFE